MLWHRGLSFDREAKDGVQGNGNAVNRIGFGWRIIRSGSRGWSVIETSAARRFINSFYLGICVNCSGRG